RAGLGGRRGVFRHPPPGTPRGRLLHPAAGGGSADAPGGGRPVRGDMMAPAATRSRARRRAAWGLLWCVALFVSLQPALLGVLESSWDFRDPEYAAKLERVRARLGERPGARPLVVLLGSSRTGVGIRPDRLPPLRTPSGEEPLVFNAALCGSGPTME